MLGRDIHPRLYTTVYIFMCLKVATDLIVKQERPLFCLIRAKNLGSRDSRRTVPGLVLSLLSAWQLNLWQVIGLLERGFCWIFGRRAEHLDSHESLN